MRTSLPEAGFGVSVPLVCLKALAGIRREYTGLYLQMGHGKAVSLPLPSLLPFSGGDLFFKRATFNESPVGRWASGGWQ